MMKMAKRERNTKRRRRRRNKTNKHKHDKNKCNSKKKTKSEKMDNHIDGASSGPDVCSCCFISFGWLVC